MVAKERTFQTLAQGGRYDAVIRLGVPNMSKNASTLIGLAPLAVLTHAGESDIDGLGLLRQQSIHRQTEEATHILFFADFACQYERVSRFSHALDTFIAVSYPCNTCGGTPGRDRIFRSLRFPEMSHQGKRVRPGRAIRDLSARGRRALDLQVDRGTIPRLQNPRVDGDASLLDHTWQLCGQLVQRSRLCCQPRIVACDAQ